MNPIQPAKLLCVGIRGSTPGDPLLEGDLDACASAGVGGVILFDVDVPAMGRALGSGAPREEALERAVRNITGPDQLRELISHIRLRLGRDILISIDQEGGRVARLSPRRGFQAEPSAREFASLDPSERVGVAGRQATQLRELGIDLNYAPCVDLAIDPENEVIVASGRSYGSDPETVIEVATAVLDAQLEAGVASCIKHFPGHGSSRGDTHLSAVDVTGTWEREFELAPYRAFAQRPGMAVMAGHLLHRGLDRDRPASLSSTMIDGILRQEIDFDGVVITDSIDMRAIADRWSPEEAAVAAINAGVDLVIDGLNLVDRGEHPAVAISAAVERATSDGTIAGGFERIERSLRRIELLMEQVRPATGL